MLLLLLLLLLLHVIVRTNEKGKKRTISNCRNTSCKYFYRWWCAKKSAKQILISLTLSLIHPAIISKELYPRSTSFRSIFTNFKLYPSSSSWRNSCKNLKKLIFFKRDPTEEASTGQSRTLSPWHDEAIIQKKEVVTIKTDVLVLCSRKTIKLSQFLLS